MDNHQIATELLELCGGKENIINAENCMTRLRVVVKDAEKIQRDKISKHEEVLGLVGDGADIQIVIGPGKVNKVTNEFIELSKTSTENGQETISNNAKKKNSGVKGAISTLAQVFVPLIPGIIAAGLLLGIAAILNLLVAQNILPQSDPLQAFILLITILANGCMSFLAIFVGINAAKAFGCTKILGGMIGAIVLLEGVTDFAILLNDIFASTFNLHDIIYNSADAQYSLLSAGKGGIVAVLFGVWLLSKVENWLHNHVPDNLDIVITPLVSIFVTGTLMIVILMPLAGFISTGIIAGLQFMSYSSNIIIQAIYGFVLGATFLPMVMLGLHQSLVPIYFLELDQTGYITIIAAQMMAGGANIGAAIAIYFKAKQVGHNSLKKVIASSLPTAILGIHEPLIYGVTLPIAILFVPIGIGAGIAGAFCIIMQVWSMSYGPATVLGVTTMRPESMLWYLLGLVIACVITTICTWFMIPKERVKRHMEDTEGIVADR